MFSTEREVQVHFIGIGGIGMSGIAEVLLSLGYKVTGSDLSDSANVDKLRGLGAQVFIGHDKSNVGNATVVVFSSAVDKKNLEIVAAKRKKIPLMRRAEMLAELMRLKHGIAIAGTHGKTTTTSFLATILEESRFDPTYIIGGVVSNLKGHAKVGSGPTLVAEADESDGSFLLLNPIMSVVTNIDDDHLDFYGSSDKLVKAFGTFVNKVPFYGVTALNIHDTRLMQLKEKMKKPSTTFGIAAMSDPETVADFEARDVEYQPFGATYNLFYKGELATPIKINLPGRHNILNSLGAIALAYNMKVSFELIAESIQKFDGVGRRFQLLYNNGDFEVLDDYAHHPTEILATLKTVKETRQDSKIVVVFEPHRFSRTRDCWNNFLHCFNSADELYLSPVYPASEEPIEGIDSDRLASDINKLHPTFARTMNSIEDLGTLIEKYRGQKVTLITLGAGSIGRVVRSWSSDQ